MEITVSKAEFDAISTLADERKREVDRLTDENAMLRKALFGRSTERRTPLGLSNQPGL